MRAARSRRVPAALLLAPALFLGALCFAAPAAAQVTTVETVPPEIDDEGRTTSERVDQIVLILRILAGVVLAGTVAFWWHTRPTSGDMLDESSTLVSDQEATAGET